MLHIIFIIIISLLMAYCCKRFSFLLNYTGSSHQKFVNKEVTPLVGGVSILLFILISLPDDLLHLKLFCFFIFFIGFFSDIKKINSPKLRIILQFIIILLFIYLLNISEIKTNIILLDYLLSNYDFFAILFTSFCFLIIINGSNFIDGINTLTIGYYLSLLFALRTIEFNSSYLYILLIDNHFIIILFYIFILNFFNKIFLGDSGAYLISLLFAYLLVDIHINNLFISPYYIVLLLWYPGFENLFSIIRKYRFKKSPIKPDINHFHQLLFFYLNQNSFFSKKYISSITGITINTYNFLLFMLASQNLLSSKFQITLILVSVFIYIFIYLKLLNFKKNYN